MPDFILILLSALLVAALGFGVVAFTIGREPGLVDAEPPAPAEALPADGPVAATDLEQLRFDVVVRGYRMSEVDHALAAATVTVRSLEEQVDKLTAELAAARGESGAVDRPEPAISLSKPESSDQPVAVQE